MRMRALLQWKRRSAGPITQPDGVWVHSRGKKRRTVEEDANQESGTVILFRGRKPTQQELATKPYSQGGADLIIVDESNSFSGLSDGRRRYLTVVCTRVRDRRDYEKVLDDIPQKKGHRSKYYNTRERDLLRIVEAISEKDIEIVEAHKKIDHGQLPDVESKKRFYMGVFRKAVTRATALDSERDADILIDSPPLKINAELIEFGRELSADQRIRWYETKRSASDRYLTIHDYETGVVSDRIEDIPGKDHLYKRLKRRVRNVDRGR